MASPAVGGTTEGGLTAAGTSLVVTLPGSGSASDEYIVIIAKGSIACTINALTDWTELLDENSAAGLAIIRYTGAGVPSNPTFTQSVASRSVWGAYRITGANKSITPEIGTTATGTSTTPNPPSRAVTGGPKDILAIAFFAAGASELADDDTLVTTFPTNYSSGQIEKTGGISGTNLAGLLGAAASQVTNVSSEDPGTFTQNASRAWRANTLVIHPALPVTSGEYEFSLTNPVTDPPDDNNHSVTVRAWATAGAGELQVRLLQGTTELDAWTETLTGSAVDYIHPIAAGDAANITDYDDLRLEIKAEGLTGLTVRVSQAYVSVPEGTDTGATVTPSAVGRTASVSAPTVSAGSNIAATTLSRIASVAAPAILAVTTISPASVVATANVSSAVAQAGAVITATSVSRTTAIPLPTRSAGSTVVAVTLARPAVVSAPTVTTTSNVNISPTSISIITSVAGVTVSFGTTVSATSVSGIATVPLPSVGAETSANISASTVSRTSAVSAATVHAGAGILATAVNRTSTVSSPTTTAGSNVVAISVARVTTIPLPAISTGATVIAPLFGGFGTPQSLYTSETPAYVSGSNDTGSFGHDIVFNTAGRITGLRYYRPAGISGSVTSTPMHIWDSGGTLLVDTATSGETTTVGWYTATLGSPISVTAGQTVRIAYDLNPPKFSMSRTPNTLHTIGDITLGTGYSRFGSYARPTSVENQLLFADVIFEPGSTVGKVTVSSPAVQTGSTISATAISCTTSIATPGVEGAVSVDISASPVARTIIIPSPIVIVPSVLVPYARAFDNTDDFIQLSPGAASAATLGNTTTVIIYRRTGSAHHKDFVSANTSDGNSRIRFLSINDNNTLFTLDRNAGLSSYGPTILSSDGWMLLAVSKSSGTTTPRFHKYVYGTNTWTHVNGDTAISNGQATGATGYFQIGRIAEAGSGPDCDMQIAGIFNSNLSDTQIEDLPFSLEAWRTLNPLTLWLLDQQTANLSVRDITGGGANSTSVTGTTTIGGPDAFVLPNYARRFNGTSDRITTSIGGLASTTTGNTTIVMIANRYPSTSTTEVPLAIRTNTSGDDSPMTIYHDVGTSYYLTSTGVLTSGFTYPAEWHLFAVSKATGTNVSRWHKYNYANGIWTHTDSGESRADSSSVGSSGIVEIGRRVPDSWNYFSGEIQAIGIFPSVLSDGNIETLPFSLSAWTDLSPSALWLLNQDDVDTGLTDSIGSADQTAITGTEIVYGPVEFVVEVGGVDATISATAITKAATVSAPTIEAGSTIAATAFVQIATVSSPVTVASSTVVATAVNRTTTIPAPVTRASSTVIAVAFTRVVTIPTPVPAGSTNISAITITRLATVSSVTVSVTSNINISAPAVAATAIIPVSGLAGGISANINATTVTTSATVPAASINTSSTVVATTISRLTIIPVPVPAGSSVINAITIARIATIPSPTVTIGTIVVSPAFQRTSTIPVPAVTTQAGVIAISVLRSATVATPQFSTGSRVDTTSIIRMATVSSPTFVGWEIPQGYFDYEVVIEVVPLTEDIILEVEPLSSFTAQDNSVNEEGLTLTNSPGHVIIP